MNAAGPVIFGEVLFDCFDDGSRVMGGAPFNVAWHLAAFGHEPWLVSRVGADADGDAILDAMTAAGMRTDGVGRDPLRATGEVQVTLIGGQPAFDIVDDRAWDHITPPIESGSRPPLIYHGTLALRHAAACTALDAIVGDPPAPIFIDVNLRAPWWNAESLRTRLNRAHWLKINDAELAELAGGRDGSLADKAMKLLKVHDLERIIVTRGANGAFTIGSDGECIESNPGGAARVVDTVGAGDAFACVCIMGIIGQWPWHVTMTRASDFAAELIQRRGALLTERDVYRRRLRDWH